MDVLLRILGYLRKYTATTATAYVLLMGATAIDLITPNIIKNVIDCGIKVGPVLGTQRAACSAGVDARTLLWRAVATIAILTVIKAVMQFGQGFLGQYGAQGIAYDIRNDIYEHLKRL